MTGKSFGSDLRTLRACRRGGVLACVAALVFCATARGAEPSRPEGSSALDRLIGLSLEAPSGQAISDQVEFEILHETQDYCRDRRFVM